MSDKEAFERRPLIERGEGKGVSAPIYSLRPPWGLGAAVATGMTPPDTEKEEEVESDETMTHEAAGDSPPSYPAIEGLVDPSEPVQAAPVPESPKDVEKITSQDEVPLDINTSSKETGFDETKLSLNTENEPNIDKALATLASTVKILNERSNTNQSSKHSDTDSEYCDCKSQVSLTSQTFPSQENCGIEEENLDNSEKGCQQKNELDSPSRSSICTCPQSTLTTLSDFCRICHCEGDSELGPLIAPCFCRGSLRYVHQACLQKWIKSSDTKHCELCGYHFVMDSKLKPFHKWKKLSMSTSERRKILCSVMFHIIAITCVIWSLYVLIEKTASEIHEGKLQWPFWTKLVVVAIGFTGGLVFMYVQCKVYVQLWKRLKAFNRVIYVKNNSTTQSGAQDDDTINDVGSRGSMTSDPEQGTHRGLSTGDQSSRARDDDIVVVDICCRDNN